MDPQAASPTRSSKPCRSRVHRRATLDPAPQADAGGGHSHSTGGWWRARRWELGKDAIIALLVLLGAMYWDDQLADRQDRLARQLANRQDGLAREQADRAEVLETRGSFGS